MGKTNINTSCTTSLSRGSPSSEASLLLYSNRYFFRLVIGLQHLQHLSVGRAFMYTPVVCVTFLTFLQLETFIVYRKKLLFLISLCGCNIVNIYILKREKKKLLQVGSTNVSTTVHFFNACNCVKCI